MTSESSNGKRGRTIIENISNAVVIVTTVVAATFWISTQMISMKVGFANHDKTISKLVNFMQEGDRFTKRDWERVEERIEKLEDWTKDAPAARTLLKEYKEALRFETSYLRTQVTEILREIQALQHSLAIHGKITEGESDGTEAAR